MRLITLIPVTAVALAAGVLIGTTMGQEQPGGGHDMTTMQGGQAQAGASGPAADAFKAAGDRMMQGMTIPLTGDADVDFAQGMVVHHQGAIDTAKVQLQYGSDPELRKLAQGIIKAQEGEIAFLKGWLAKNGR